MIEILKLIRWKFWISSMIAIFISAIFLSYGIKETLKNDISEGTAIFAITFMLLMFGVAIGVIMSIKYFKTK